MVKRKKKKAGRPKKLPTRVVRIQKAKPDFITIASKDESILHQDTFVGFVDGCNYVWDTYINKVKTIHPMP